MEPHLEDGTQRLELPVSRMTLKVWGGVPTLISEKSVDWLDGVYENCKLRDLTLSVQVVLNGDRVILLDADLLALLLGEWIPVSRVFLLKELDLVLQGESLLSIVSVTFAGSKVVR